MLDKIFCLNFINCFSPPSVGMHSFDLQMNRYILMKMSMIFFALFDSRRYPNIMVSLLSDWKGLLSYDRKRLINELLTGHSQNRCSMVSELVLQTVHNGLSLIYILCK